MHECRKKRDGKTGIATNGGSGAKHDTTYDESDISATSNSRWRNIRKNVSSTGRSRHVRSMPSARTRPSASARVRSYCQQASVSARFGTRRTLAGASDDHRLPRPLHDGAGGHARLPRAADLEHGAPDEG